ncbi:PAS domain-containing protein [Arcobacter sp. LA11]|uniref:PAS domain-containing protein n=1 Tax=Arcobacter sp. LA11 TaxID=1898176 RepID=UPI000934FC74|nr:PAS domain-containing protein [Arcobacter sp. LA11]
MINNKKYSLTLINSVLLVVFLLFIIFAISISSYFSTQKVIDYNINEYFKQTTNITHIIIDTEQKDLNNIAFDISKIIKKEKTEELELGINSLTAVDQIDILFLKTDDEIINYSNSLFDTELLIKEISKRQILYDNTILSASIDDEKFIILLSRKKIIDKVTGRVSSILYVGKILNDNFTIINKIKQKALLEDIYIFFKEELIATTSHKELIDLSFFNKNKVIKKGDLLYFNKKINIYEKQHLDIVFITKNSTFELLKEDFIRAGSLLLIFILISFAILYITSNKYIIKPFSKLLKFAKRAKDNENVEYIATNVLEFDNFAVDLKSIIDELRELKEHYSRAIEGVQDGLWDLDLKTKKLFCSNRYSNMLGYSDKDKINSISFWKNSIHKDDYFKTLKKIVNHVNGKSNLYEDDYRVRCKDGSYKWIKVRGKIFFDENKKALRMTGFHTDIDDIIRLQNDNLKKEKMLYQQSKLASMGEMIGNIAHQWRQPLNVISTIASSQIMQLELGLTKKEETIKDLNKLIDTVQYLSNIIDKFRYFFNPDKELETFYIDELIMDNLEIFESSYKLNDIDLIMNLQHIEISGYKFELMQVIINLINNSRDALLERYSIDDPKLIFMENSVKDKFLEIRVYDNACGIKETIKEKIYEPYFTTKHQSQGTGLGLYMSNEIVKKHLKGKLMNETISFSYKGKEYIGEEFRIILPL